MWNATTTSDDHPNRRLPWQSVGLMVASHRGQLQRPPIARWKGRDRRFKMGETPSEIALFTVVLFSFAAAGKGLPPPPRSLNHSPRQTRVNIRWSYYPDILVFLTPLFYWPIGFPVCACEGDFQSRGSSGFIFPLKSHSRGGPYPPDPAGSPTSEQAPSLKVNVEC